MGLGVKFVLSLWLWVQVSLAYDVFEFGSSYKAQSSTIQFIDPGEMAEVCEGDSFMLQCPAGLTILVAPEADIQFGRNGVWEPRTRCGAGQQLGVSCGTMTARTELLGSCEGREVCGAHLYGHLRGTDPCPAPAGGGDRPRKYLTVRYTCVGSLETVSTTPMTTSSSTTTSTTTSQTTSIKYEPRSAVETLESDLFDKLDSLEVLDENVTDYVNEFFEQAINNIPSAGAESAPQTSILNMTERISQKLMDLLDEQDEISSLEFKTSQLTVKLVKKKFQPASVGRQDSETKWESRDKSISLPDQEELIFGDKEAEGGEARLEIMMAAFENMETGMKSASDVISVSVNNDNNVNLSKPVTFLLPHNGDRDVSCAFWSFNEDLWSRDGCVTLCHNDTHTKCSCDHLTNFALIFNVHSEFIAEEGVHANQLKVITYIGFTISILCMVLTIIMFMFLKGHSTDRDVIHVNLCLSLLTAEIIFMFGIDKTANTALCSVISILLHYFFLSSFAWMFLEGFQIYELLVRVFESSKTSRVKHFLVGYGAPLMIVVFSLSVDLIKIYQDNDSSDMCFDPLELSSYGTSNYCWLAVDNNFILSFIIPAVTVIISNIAMLVFAVHSMTVHKMKKDRAPNQDILMSYMKGVGVLMCLLGSTWIFGILLLAFNDLIIAYAFTILNSLQGVGIFVFQCLLNPQTRKILSRNLQRFKLNLCQKNNKRKGKYQRTNTYEITDLSTTLNTAGRNEENQIVSTNPNE